MIFYNLTYDMIDQTSRADLQVFSLSFPACRFHLCFYT